MVELMRMPFGRPGRCPAFGEWVDISHENGHGELFLPSATTLTHGIFLGHNLLDWSHQYFFHQHMRRLGKTIYERLRYIFRM